MTSFIKLIVGIGNPGPEYENTRHNAGVWFVERLLAGHLSSLKPEKRFKGLVTKTNIVDTDCFILIPTTFMNNSGEAVSELTHFYKISPEEILIVHDDLDLPCGTVRLKQGGGHGGHNGLQNIIQHLKTPNFLRLRIGIDHPGHKDQVVDYVLKKPQREEKEKIDDAITRTLNMMPEIMAGHLQAAIQKLHSSNNQEKL